LTRTVPIICPGAVDAVGLGYAESLARPGGNVTGFSTMEFSVFGKILGTLKQIAPGTSRVAMIYNPDNPGTIQFRLQFESFAVPLSVQPISAETITTDSTGLVAGEVKVKTADVEIPAYRAMPDKGGPFPTVLVVQEVFGVHEHIKDLCRRFAKAGYFAIAPELYVRQGDPSKYTEIPKLVAELVSKVPDEQGQL